MIWSFSATPVGSRCQWVNSLLVLRVDKPIPRVKYGHIVNVLHVALLEVGRHAKSFTQEVQSVKSFGLRLGYGWQMAAARKLPKSDIVAPAILKKDSIRSLAVGAGGCVVQQGAAHISVFVVYGLGEAGKQTCRCQ